MRLCTLGTKITISCLNSNLLEHYMKSLKPTIWAHTYEQDIVQWCQGKSTSYANLNYLTFSPEYTHAQMLVSNQVISIKQLLHSKLLTCWNPPKYRNLPLQIYFLKNSNLLSSFRSSPQLRGTSLSFLPQKILITE